MFKTITRTQTPAQTPAQNIETFQNDADTDVGAYKLLVANGCLNIYKSKNETMGKLW